MAEGAAIVRAGMRPLLDPACQSATRSSGVANRLRRCAIIAPAPRGPTLRGLALRGPALRGIEGRVGTGYGDASPRSGPGAPTSRVRALPLRPGEGVRQSPAVGEPSLRPARVPTKRVRVSASLGLLREFGAFPGRIQGCSSFYHKLSCDIK